MSSTLVQHQISLHSRVQRCLRKAHAVLRKQFSMPQCCTDEILSEGKALLSLHQDGITYLKQTLKDFIFDKVRTGTFLFFRGASHSPTSTKTACDQNKTTNYINGNIKRLSTASFKKKIAVVNKILRTKSSFCLLFSFFDTKRKYDLIL